MEKKRINPSTTSAFRGEYCQKLIEMGKKGDSICMFCAAVGISEHTFYEWVDKYPPFDKANKEAKAYAQAWWESFGQQYVVTQYDKSGGETFNYNLYRLIVGGRFGLATSPKVRNKKLGKGSLADKAQAMMEMLGDGDLQTEQAKALSGVLKDIIAIEEHTDLKDKIAGMEAKMEAMGALTPSAKIAEEPEYTTDDDIETK